MADNPNTPPADNKPAQPNPAEDIVSGLFADDTPPADNKPQNPPADNKPATPPANPDDKGDQDKGKNVNVDEIVEAAVKKAVEKITPLISQSANDVTRNQQLSSWLNTEDGKYFAQHKDFLKKAANDPRWKNVPIEQLPQIIMKRESYAKVLQQMREDADRAAKDSQIGGTGVQRPREQTTTEKDYSKMSREEFLKEAAENKRKAQAKRQ